MDESRFRHRRGGLRAGGGVARGAGRRNGEGRLRTPQVLVAKLESPLTAEHHRWLGLLGPLLRHLPLALSGATVQGVVI